MRYDRPNESDEGHDMNETSANFELQRAVRYGWEVGAGFFAPAPKRAAPKRAGFLARLFGGL
jgi:hypothetical protein